MKIRWNEWFGTFQTKEYSLFFEKISFVHGTIKIRIPENFREVLFSESQKEDIQQKLKLCAEMTFEGFYHNGQTNEIKIHYHLTNEGIILSGFIVEEKVAEQEECCIIKFHLMHHDSNEISGVYQSCNPYDMGTFQLKRKEYVSEMISSKKDIERARY
jgi:hypothetical protein